MVQSELEDSALAMGRSGWVTHFTALLWQQDHAYVDPILLPACHAALQGEE